MFFNSCFTQCCLLGSLNTVHLSICAVISQCKKGEMTSWNRVGIFPSRGDIAAGLRFTALAALMSASVVRLSLAA